MLRFCVDMLRYPFAVGHPKNKFGHVLQFVMKDYPTYFRVKPRVWKLVLFPFLVVYTICRKQKFERFGFRGQTLFFGFLFLFATFFSQFASYNYNTSLFVAALQMESKQAVTSICGIHTEVQKVCYATHLQQKNNFGHAAAEALSVEDLIDELGNSNETGERGDKPSTTSGSPPLSGRQENGTGNNRILSGTILSGTKEPLVVSPKQQLDAYQVQQLLKMKTLLQEQLQKSVSTGQKEDLAEKILEINTLLKESKKE